jgi:hypothetical protein
MFKKIHSNRDPNETVLRQIKKEFAPHFERCANTITKTLQRKPRLIFALMIVAMAFSAVISFTAPRNKELAEKSVKRPKVNVVSDGFDQISATAAAIRQTIRLKKNVDSLATKKNLSKRDSDVLDSDLIKLEKLNKPFKR